MFVNNELTFIGVLKDWFTIEVTWCYKIEQTEWLQEIDFQLNFKSKNSIIFWKLKYPTNGISNTSTWN